MVENQQSIKTVLSFGAKSVEPEILERLLIGRSVAAMQLSKSIEGIAINGNNQQTLIVAKRGMGKTHLLRVLYARASEFIAKDQLKVAYFTEEEYGVDNFFDFLTRILFAFIRWNKNDESFLNKKLEELQATSPSYQVAFLENLLKEYIGDKPLLILAENFGDILNSIGPTEQGKLRAWIYENPRVSIIATIQNLTDDFDREDRPFFGFFNLYYLKNLSLDETLEFLLSLAELDGRVDVKEHLQNKGKAQVRAIFDLVKGNHRLLVTFYEFLKSDTLATLSNHFIKTINDLKPYYETYIRYLPPQQQKIIRYIALSRKPQLGTEISRNCFIEQASLSKQLSELSRKQLLEVLPDQNDKRNKLYDINEPLLRISIEVGEHREGITALFVDFLALYYDENELEDKKTRFEAILSACKTLQEEKGVKYEIEAIERALIRKHDEEENLQFIEQLDEVLSYSFNGTMNENLEWLDSWKPKILDWLYKWAQACIYQSFNNYKTAICTLSQIKEKDLKYPSIHFTWASCLVSLGEEEKEKKAFVEAFRHYRIAHDLYKTNHRILAQWANACFTFSRLFDDLQYHAEGIELMKKAIERKSDDADCYIDLAVALLNADDDQMDLIVEHLNTAISLAPNSINAILMMGKMLGDLNQELKEGFDSFPLFLNSFAKLTISVRVIIWNLFKSLNNFKLFKYVFHLFENDFKSQPDQLKPVIIEWVVNILGNKKEPLQSDQVSQLKNMLEKFDKNFQELNMLKIYLDVYTKVVLEKNTNALYSLPKEQRLFFKKHILQDEPPLPRKKK